MDGVDARPPLGMKFTVETPSAGAAVVTIRGELDLSSVDQLASAVNPLIAEGLDSLILELGDLRFADSSAIALWVQWSTQVGRIELRNVSALLRRVITTMGLTERLTLVP